MLAVAACDPVAPSRELAVTVTEAAEIVCTGFTNSDALEQSSMDGIAKDFERLWEEQHLSEPPRPAGRILRVNETERELRAWFEPAPRAASTGGVAFDSPDVVYRGVPHDDYIEGVYLGFFNTDTADREAGREPCGDRLRGAGTLSLTDVRGVLGRIRWQDHLYVDTVSSSCAGRIECVRDVAVEGLELD